MSSGFTVEPFSQPLGDDASVHAEVAPGPEEDSWSVLVVVTRPADKDALLGDELDVELVDAAGNVLEPVETATGPLVEAGGSLGMSSNANLRFSAGPEAPAELTVRYAGHAARFGVVEDDG